MTVTMTFELPREADSLEHAQNGKKYAEVLDQLDSYFVAQGAYAGDTNKQALYKGLRQVLGDLMDQQGI